MADSSGTRRACGRRSARRRPCSKGTSASRRAWSTSAGQATRGRLFNITRSEITRLERLVTDFLAYARPRPLRLAVLPAASLLAAAREVLADGEQMQQVLLNLMQNALAATEGSGRPPRVVLRARRAGPAVELEVEDNGSGIPVADRRRIFELFFSTRKGGTGLGLAIAQRIVSQHGGTIEVRSTPGEGSTFSVFLPAAPGVPVSATITGPISMAPLRAATIPPVPVPVPAPDPAPSTTSTSADAPAPPAAARGPR